MSRQVDFSPLFCTQSIFRCNKANEIVAAYSCLNTLAIATDIGPPILIDLRGESFKSFSISKNINFSTPICIAVNQKSNIVVTGHSDGTICVFSVDDNYELVSSHRNLHKHPITAIGFSPTSDDFYVGDISGLLTKISYSKSITKSFSEKKVYQDTRSITKIHFPIEKFRYEFGIAVMSDHFVVIDPKLNDGQVTARYPQSGNFEKILSVVLCEGEKGVVDIYAFANKECHYFTIGSDVSLIYHGITHIYDNDSDEYTTRALNWNSKMIAVITNNSVVKFINSNNIGLSIERNIKDYSKSIVQRRQSPLSQAIISTTLFTLTYNEYLYCILPQNIIKMNYEPWQFMIKKYVKNKNWDDAILMILNASNFKELDAIGLPARISERNLLMKQLSEEIITQYIQYGISSDNEDIINRSFRDCVRLSSKFSIQKFIVSEMLPIVLKSGHAKLFYTTIFRNRRDLFNGFITPEFVKGFLNFCKDDPNFAESCLMGINIPQVYANDIAAIIYESNLIQIFIKIMVFTFRDFITPCLILEQTNSQNELLTPYEYKNFLEFIFTDDIRSLRKRMIQKANIMKQLESLTDLTTSTRQRKIKKEGLNSSEITGRKTVSDDEDDSHHNYHIHWLSSSNPSIDGSGSIDTLSKSDKEILNDKIFEDEKILQLRVLAQRTLCMWLFCPASLIGFHRIDRLFNLDDDDDLECATTVFRKCSKLLPLRYDPNHQLDSTCFADTIMYTINQFDLSTEEEKYNKFLPILNIICPFYAQQQVAITRCALRLTTLWCFKCFEQPQSLRIEVLNKIRSTYPNLINEEDFISYSASAGFIFALQNKYLETKRYDIIVSAMINEKEYQSNIFDFLNSHLDDVEEVKNAILQNLDGLTIIDSDSLFNFVFKNFDDLHSKIFIKLEQNKLIKYLYLKSYIEELSNINASKHIDEYFDLLCRYNPNGAAVFYRENYDSLNMEKARYACKKYGITDCLIAIMKTQNNQEEIIKYVEKSLIDIIEYKLFNNVLIKSEEQLSKYPKILQVSNGIDALLEYQKEVTINEDGSLKDIKCLKFLSVFDFPFYISRRKSESVRSILILLYSRFIIGSTEYIPVNLLFKHVLVQISQFGFEEIQSILNNLSKQITFKKFFSESVTHMFIEDTCYLIDRNCKNSTKGIKTTANACCSGCLKPLYPPQYQNVFVFPCGHIFHFEYECIGTDYDENQNLMKPDICPICGAGETPNETLQVQVPSKIKKLSNQQINRLYRRLNYALERNYGANIEEYRPSAVYFASDTRDVANGRYQIPQEIKFTKMIPIQNL